MRGKYRYTDNYKAILALKYMKHIIVSQDILQSDTVLCYNIRDWGDS